MRRYREAVAFFLIAMTMCLLAYLLPKPVFSGSLLENSAFATRVRILQIVLCIYGIAFLIMAAVSLVLIRHRETNVSTEFVKSLISLKFAALKEFLNARKIIFNRKVFWRLAIIVLIGVVIRAFFLNQPMRYDESYTYMKFVRPSFLHTFNYLAPNNHVLHSLVVRSSVGLFGNSPLVIRLPAFLAGVFVIPLIYVFCKRLIPNSFGLLAAGIVGVFPYLILYDTMARGYSMLTAITLLLAIVFFDQNLEKRFSKGHHLLAAVLMSAGAFVMPSFLFPAVGLMVWKTVLFRLNGISVRQTLNGFIFPISISTLAITFLLYTPVILVTNGFEPIFNNSFVKNLGWNMFLKRIPDHIQSIAHDFSRSIPVLIVVLFTVLIVAGLWSLVRSRNKGAFLLLPLMVLGGVAVLVAKQVIPFERTWIYFLPILFAYADFGLSHFLKSGRSAHVITYLMLFVGLISICIGVMSNRCILRFDDTGSFLDAKEVSVMILRHEREGDTVQALVPASDPTEYYLAILRDRSTHAKVILPQEVSARTFYVVKKSEYSLLDLTTKPVQKIFETQDAALFVSKLK